VTNDDGVLSPGLLALVRALRSVAHVDVLAPERNWSACSHQRTVDRPLRVRTTQLGDGSPAMATDGSPSDCVSLAVSGILDTPPGLVIAGINAGSNVGHDIVYSGTIAAATEAVMRGIPGMAISLNDWSGEEFDQAADFAVQLVAQVERHGMSIDTVLNVNVPSLPAARIRGVALTTLGRRSYANRLERRTDPFGAPYYWIASGSPVDLAEPGTDISALKEGLVSITPLAIDRTHREMVDEFAHWSFDWKT
jgi:5'-nucleotidase